ncbi:MAG: hypothetical protein ACI8ZX_003037 [Planctomycetota bacterium]|jgi:hypothetical protein
MQDSCHPFILDTLENMEQRRKYIHYNPIDPEIVFHERYYFNSSYRIYDQNNIVFST